MLSNKEFRRLIKRGVKRVLSIGHKVATGEYQPHNSLQRVELYEQRK